MNKFWNKLAKFFQGTEVKKSIYTALILRLLIILVLFSICRIGFYLANISYFPGMTILKFIRMMIGGLKFDISAILYTNLLFILLHLLPFSFRYNRIYQRVLKYLFFIFNGVALAANVADMIYYKFILKRTTAELFHEFSNESNILNLFFRFIIDYWYLSLFWIAMIYGMVRLYRKIKIKRTQINNPLLNLSFGLVMAVLFFCATIIGLRGGIKHSTRPITLSNAGKYVEFPAEMAIVLNTPFSIYRTLGIEVLEPLNYFESEADLSREFSPLHNADTTGEFAPKNVVIIIMESFATEYIGSLNRDLDNGNYQGYTPFLDSLIDHSKVYLHSFANGKKTIDALPSVLSGIPSMEQHFVLSHYSGNEVTSIATYLKEKGYHTSFFHGAPNGSMGLEAYVNIVNFDHYYGSREYGNNADFDGMWGIWDEEFFQFFADNLESIPSPFLSVLFSVTSHHPFEVPERYEGKFKEGPLKVHKCINYSDYSLKRLFDRLAQLPSFENTIFVITGDHCSLTYFPEYQSDVGYFRVPIIFYEPGSDFVGLEDQLAQHIDIVPTLLRYLNYDKPFFSFGQDLLDEPDEQFVINWRSNLIQLFMGDYVLQSKMNESYGLFNFKKDLMLSENLLGQMPEIQKKMELKRMAFLQQYNIRMIENRLIAK